MGKNSFETKVIKISKLLKEYPNRSKKEIMNDLKKLEKKGMIILDGDEEAFLTKTGMSIARCVGFEIAEYDKDVV